MRRASTTAASSVEPDHLVPHGDRLPQQVADLAAVVAGEVRAHPLAQVGRLAHVERHPPPVDEPVDAGRAGQGGGQAELGGLGVPGQPGEDEEVVEAEHAPGSPPARAAGAAGRRWPARPPGPGGRDGGRAGSAPTSVPRRQLGTSSRTSRRASAAVSTKLLASRSQPSRLRAALRKPMSKRTLWPTRTVPPDELDQGGQHGARCAGPTVTIASVIPVSTVMAGGMAEPGLTSVWNVPRHSPPRTLTAPISVMACSVARPAGGLQVDHAERDLGQRCPEIVERALHGRNGSEQVFAQIKDPGQRPSGPEPPGRWWTSSVR